MHVLMTFYFEEEIYKKINPSLYGIKIISKLNKQGEEEEEEETYEYIGEQNTYKIYLAEINEIIWNVYTKNIQTNLIELYGSFEEFKRIGGMAYCIIESSTSEQLKSNMILSICISSFITDTIHDLNIYTNPNWRRRGLATTCAYVYIHNCIKKGIIPNWCCSTQSSDVIKIAQKLAFNPIVNIPALCITKKNSKVKL